MFRKLKIKQIPFDDLVVIPTIFEDNSCFAHSILAACRKDYGKLSIADKKSLARKFRDTTSTLLTEIDLKTDKTYYEGLFNGRIEDIGKELPDYSLEQMVRELQGDNFLDHHLQELISNAFNKDIYFLSAKTEDVFIDTKEMYFLCYKGRNSIIILHSIDHYEVVGTLKGTKINTVFQPEDPLIQYLNERILENIKK
jgi:hypothetical protein